ncbi:MAG TPA: argininosuccinate synthase [Anaerolineae bacterium]|nr:argininosuccinate synthase [Anaerolineae bacterium]
MKNISKIVLAYSGGLDTSIIIPWLKENYHCEVIAMVADIGQGEELEGIEEKAQLSGASKIYIEDLKEEFITDFVFPTVMAGAVYEGKYLLGTSFARPLIARRQVEIARRENADALCHGATGKGNDQVRFELTYKTFAPDLMIVAPWREWNIRSREDAIEYAASKNIPISQTKEKIYSRDRNLWHMSHEGGELEDPWKEPREDVYVLTVSPETAPVKAEYVEIGFDHGKPVSINGKNSGPVALIEKLNEIGSRNGVGRVNLVENRLVGMKSRGVYETPGGTVLCEAHNALETLTLDRDTLHLKQILAIRYAELVYYGKWYSPLREALHAFVEHTQEYVSGDVRIKLYKGNCSAVGIKSPYSLYRKDIATFSMDEVYNQSDAEGFINLFGLPETVRAQLRNSGDK